MKNENGHNSSPNISQLGRAKLQRNWIVDARFAGCFALIFGRRGSTALPTNWKRLSPRCEISGLGPFGLPQMGHYNNASGGTRKMSLGGLRQFRKAGSQLQLLEKKEMTK
jgi:hypothetical protein